MSFKPTLLPYNSVGRFRFWSQKVLPTIYDDSLSYYEVLTKLTNYLNSFIENIETMQTNIDTINDAFGDLEESLTEDIEDFKAEVQETLDGYLDDLNDYKDDINEDIDNFIETVNRTLEGFEEQFENFRNIILNNLTSVGFVPVLWGGTDDAEHYYYTYNDGSEDAMEHPVDIISAQARMSEGYTNDNGNRNPAVYFSIADNCRKEMNEGDPRYANAYIFIKSDTDISGHIYISDNYNIQSGTSNAIGMSFSITSGTHYIPFKITSVIGSPNGVIGRWLGIEFEEYGSVSISVGMIFATSDNTSIYYTSTSTFAELYTSIINDMIEHLEYLPEIDYDLNTNGYYVLQFQNDKLVARPYYNQFPSPSGSGKQVFTYDPDEPSPHLKWSELESGLPDYPTEDGEYALKATILSGNVTTEWVEFPSAQSEVIQSFLLTNTDSINNI